MKILLINQYYYPDHSASSQFLTDLAEHLASEGRDVTVLCSRSGYDGGVIGPRRDSHNGVKIRRVPACTFGKGSMVGRLADYLSFFVLASVSALFFARRYDVAITLTTPPLISFLGRLLQLFRGSRFVYWLMDSYPASAIQYGILRPDRASTRLLSNIAKSTLRAADAVVALGQCMRRHVREMGVPDRRIVIIDNWADCRDIVPIPKDENPLVDELGLHGKFVVAYSGNMGLCHSFETILEGAERLQEREDIVFLFVGGGKRRDEIARRVDERGLSNVRFLPYQKRHLLRYSLTLADVHLISQRATMTGLIVSSKLYGILAAGVPALLVGPAETQIGQIILRGQCGTVVEEGDTDGFVEFVRTVYDNPKTRRRLGNNARRVCADHFDTSVGLARWQETLDYVTGKYPKSRPLPPELAVPEIDRIGVDSEIVDDASKNFATPARQASNSTGATP